MADLEELAFKRDRRYLLRLALMLPIGAAALVAVFDGLTGANVSGCLADAYLGRGNGSETAPKAAAEN